MAHKCFRLIYTLCQNCSLNSIFFFPRVDKKRDKIERKILDSQERAFWDVHRPVVSKITDGIVIIASALTNSIVLLTLLASSY